MNRNILLVAGHVLAIAVLSAGSSRAQTFQPNSQKYRERNPSAATGRSGSAQLSARLLQAKDGSTKLEVSTGELDSDATPPGMLSKVQLKGLDAEGEAVLTLNYGPLAAGGYWANTYAGFGPGQPFQVQGNIRGIDGRRTDVVTVTASVRLRPDLAPTEFQAPARTRVNTPIQIGATIRELNGHVGARADCVLFVDDVEADRSEGIWVDSGDSVSCAFSQTFTTAGSHSLRVSVLDVRPVDWDTTNNSVEGSVEAFDTTDFAYAYASAWSYNNYHYQQKSSGRFTNAANTGGYDWLDEYSEDDVHRDGFYYYAYGYSDGTAAASELSVDVSDGVNRYSVTTLLAYCNGWNYDTSSGRAISWYVDGCGWSVYVDVNSWAGTVTYFSRHFRRSFTRTADGDVYAPASEWTSNGAYNEPGVFTNSDRTIDVRVAMSDGTIFALPLTVSLTGPYEVDFSQPRYCGADVYVFGRSEWCNEYSYRYSYHSGYAYATGSSF